MTKLQFFSVLRSRLSALPRADREDRLRFYEEMIDDRMEEGLSEEEAVAAVGDLEEISAQIHGDMPNIPPKRRRKAGEILLLVLGAPLWIPLLIAAGAVVLSLYISWWAILISLWAVFVSLGVSSLAGLTAGIGFAAAGNGLTGFALVGCGFLLGGLSLFLFLGCREISKLTLALTGKAARSIGNRFTKKEAE